MDQEIAIQRCQGFDKWIARIPLPSPYPPGVRITPQHPHTQWGPALHSGMCVEAEEVRGGLLVTPAGVRGAGPHRWRRRRHLLPPPYPPDEYTVYRSLYTRPIHPVPTYASCSSVLRIQPMSEHRLY
jgi:hypothetical protein